MPRIYVCTCDPSPGTQAYTIAPLPRSHFPSLFAFLTPSDVGRVNDLHFLTEKLRLGGSKCLIQNLKDNKNRLRSLFTLTSSKAEMSGFCPT